MILTFITREFMKSLNVPDMTVGQYWLCNEKIDGFDWQICAEGVEDRWVLKCNDNLQVLDATGAIIKNPMLEANSIYYITLNGSTKAYVFSETVTDSRQVFEKFYVNENSVITIGRNSDNSIVYMNTYVSGNHARLEYSNQKWIIEDLDSSNGTFVNNRKVSKSILKYGDTIFVMGLKIIVGKGFIAVNNPNDSVKKVDLDRYDLPNKFYNSDLEFDRKETFHISPRFKKDITKKSIKVDSPPAKIKPDEKSIMYTVGPSLTMGLASVAMAVFSISTAIGQGNVSSAIPTIVMAISMMIGCTLWPVLSKRTEDKTNKRNEQVRVNRYQDYISDIDKLLNNECRMQEMILKENYISTKECVERIKKRDVNLWNRNSTQNDFLTVRLGIGSGILDVDLSYKERGFDLEDDILLDKMYEVCVAKRKLNNVPITVNLFEKKSLGIIGDPIKQVEFFRGMVFQIAALYGYDEVKFIFIVNEELYEDNQFIKWLPHSWNNDHSFRFVASNKSEVKEISSYLEGVFEKNNLNIGERTSAEEYYVIFDFSDELVNSFSVLNKMYADSEIDNVSVISFRNNVYELSKECSTVVEVKGDSAELYQRDTLDERHIHFSPDIFIFEDTLALSEILSNIKLNVNRKSDALPELVEFLDMYKVNKVEHLNVTTLWHDNDPIKTLAAPIGIGTTGEVINLDLHEKFHGPHGLIAGMTGSGKSELIISYILSLAISYHPNEVSFILIDYKGGGMAKAFENLPHTAGIITNLDGSSIARSLISIESELKRRQKIFTDTSKRIGSSNIDIYKYQRLYRDGVVTEPLQHLFIISDEFAELKAQRPEFMEKLVSTARIGRSLGVHLILATQKPSGVVDDQIWSNSKFRVCLKVQDNADSMDMLKRPEAASLTKTGRFYLQVGYNELFEIGQSAWAGCDYSPLNCGKEHLGASVEVVDNNGHIIRCVQSHSGKGSTNNKKQLDVIVEYLKLMADSENVKSRKLWLPPIDQNIYLDQLLKKYKYSNKDKFVLNPVVGEYDDPSKQKQELLTLPISECGNVAVFGAAKSGRTTFLVTMIYSLITTYTPQQVNLYILDFASEVLKTFSSAPQVGDVTFLNDYEKVINAFKKLKKEIEYRKNLFSNFGGDYTSYLSKSKDTLPSMVFVINNIAAFYEVYEELDDDFIILLREGSRYGIHSVITASNLTDIRLKALQNFGQLISLQLNDESDYPLIVGRTNGLVPAKYSGRGLIRLENEVHEFQTAKVCKGFMPDFVKNECDKLEKQFGDFVAPPIPVLPQVVTRDYLMKYVSNSLEIPVGVAKQSLNISYYPFLRQGMTVALSNDNGYVAFIDGMFEVLSNNENYNVTYFNATKSFSKSVLSSCKKELALIRKALDSNKFDKDMIILINSARDFFNSLNQESKEDLEHIVKNIQGTRLHILLGETNKNYTNLTCQDFWPSDLDKSSGIWIGNGVTDQYHIEWSHMTKEMSENISDGFGFVIIGRKAELVKLISKCEEGN